MATGIGHFLQDSTAEQPPTVKHEGAGKAATAVVAAKNITTVAASYIIDVKIIQHSRIVRALTTGTSAHLPQVLQLCEFWVNIGFVDESQLPEFDRTNFDPCYIIAKERSRYFIKKWEPSVGTYL